MSCIECGKRLTKFNKHKVLSCGDDHGILFYCTECYEEGLKSRKILPPTAQV